MKRFFFSIYLFIFSIGTVFSQSSSSLEYIENTFPELTRIFHDDIGKCHAHYVFSIDVSGSMDQFEGIVVPCLQRFIQALPDNDKVTIIPFGTDTKNPLGFSGVIDSNMKMNLCNNMKSLYSNSNYDKDFRDHTNIFKATNAISQAYITNNEYKVNIGITFTDFQNNIPTPGGNFRTLTDSELAQMKTNYMSASKGCYVRNIAVELEEKSGGNESLKGYCLPQLRDKVYNDTENGLEIVSAKNSKAAIEQWFEQLRRDILVVKLKAIVTAENKAGEISMNSQTDIDGKTTAEISWNPGRLYPVMKIDSTSVSEEGFYFLNDTANYGNTRDRKQLLELGQIKNKKWGFFHLCDSINLGVSLPTNCDDELAKLGITKPLTGTKYPIDQWVFSFFLPLWATALILALILLYIFLVIRAIRINSKERLNGIVFVKDPYGDELLKKKITGAENTSIGKGGIIRVPDAEWLVSIKKEKPSPLLLFKRPYFVWSCSNGYVYNGARATSGRINYQSSTSFSVRCKAKKSDEDVTHSLTFQLRTL